MIGTMIDLIMRRKIVDNGFRDVPMSGNCHPMKMPITIEIRIHFVSVMLFKNFHIVS
jgi:hypothetical protein